MEMTAGVMTAAKSLISWLERNPSSLVTDYKVFRQDILRSTLDLSNILVRSGVSRSGMVWDQLGLVVCVSHIL